ncbi:MAG TPA: FxsB family cyclophane-forming radical SAM/SPASM peptide maturase [Rugosimonospora sp.]|nr:FxsB family cyclophane-forming radical SAM/SPASM peptide maturase [Rugosimonospora sp.]
MTHSDAAAPIQQLLLKVHSRCNLACEYCYVYRHADQGWRSQPLVMSRATVDQTVRRLSEHARAHQLTRVAVVLHGGEPLLAGLGELEYVAAAVQAALPSETTVDLKVQTNGVLLDEQFLSLFERYGIRVSVSLDGDQLANDRHRVFANGRSTYAAVSEGLALLGSERFRRLYSGLLCTVDISNDPVAVYEALLRFAPPRADFLLPHGNWRKPPPHYDPAGEDTPYADWLIAVFDRWYGAPRQETDIRSFGSIIRLLAGGRSGLETLGLDPVNLLVVETDGSIEQGDALKTVAPGAATTGLCVATHSFNDALRHPGIQARQGGVRVLAAVCQACPVVSVCGGGHYAHRYRTGSGYRNPTVYCREQYKLISHIRARVTADVQALRRRGLAPAARSAVTVTVGRDHS